MVFVKEVSGSAANRGGDPQVGVEARESVEVLPFSLPSPQKGWPIHGQVRLPRVEPCPPIVVLAHDFFESKDTGILPWLAQRLGQRFATVSFSFGGSGMDPGEDRIRHGDRFEQNTISLEVGEILEVTSALRLRGFLPQGRADVGRLGFAGVGLGGSVALLAAREAQAGAVATLGARAEVDFFAEEEREELQRNGVLEFETPRAWCTPLRLRADFLHDAERLSRSEAVFRAVAGISVPLLFVHGEEDRIVPCRESEQLFHWARKDGSRLIMMEKSGHHFGSCRIGGAPSEDLGKVADDLVSFFEQSL